MHRDFKSANILLHNGVAKVADLGFAKILKNQIVTGTILGTSVTMAPELLENRSYGLECDIWSLGVVYYQFLVGDYPYNAINDFEILKKIKSGPPKFPDSIKISEESKDFIRKCLTVDPKKRITWKAIYEHPLLNDKKGNFRETYLGSLKSKISMGENKKFYDKNIAVPNENMYPTIEFKGAELTTTDDFDKVRKEMEMRKDIDNTIIHYSQVYLEYRNMIMLTFKHGILPIYEISALPINQNLYAFLMCKRSFIDMSTLRNNVYKKVNIFNLAKYFNEFLASPEYARIIDQVNSDHEIISIYAQSFMAEVKTNNPKVQSELNLTSTTPLWQTIYREELNSYAFQLFDYRDRPGVSKDTVMRLMTFVCDLINGIKVSTDEYNRRIESLDIGFMEKQFSQRIQALYGQK
jgi:serine/threonine protein kinase